MSDMRAALCRLHEIYEHYKRILSKNKQGAFKFFFRNFLTWDDIIDRHKLMLIQNPTPALLERGGSKLPLAKRLPSPLRSVPEGDLERGAG